MTFATNNQKFINTTGFLFLLAICYNYTGTATQKKTRSAKADIKSVKFNQIRIFLSDPLIKRVVFRFLIFLFFFYILI